MIDILRGLWKLGMRRAEKEFQRYHETWNPPYSLVGCGVFFGIVGIAIAQLLTMLILVVLLWEIHEREDFWSIIVSAGIQFGAIPGFFLGFTTGIAQAWVWLRQPHPAGKICLAGAALVCVRVWLFITGIDGWRDFLPLLLMIYGVTIVWSLLLVINGIRLLNIRPPAPPAPKKDIENSEASEDSKDSKDSADESQG